MGLLWPPATNPSNVFLPQPSTRPADWPSMPAPAANTIRILAAVWNATGTNGNYCALNVSVSSGTYTVDWGDGTAPQTYTSGSKADYQYSYASSGLAPLTAEGYKTALVTITPTTGGQTITALNLNVLNSSSKNGVPNPWLDLQIHATSLTSLVVSGGSGKSTFLNACNIYSLGSVTNLSYCFSYCYSLQTVTFPSGSLASVTNLSYCFNSCYSLQTVTFPSGSLASVTNLSSCFSYCYSLQTVTFPSGSLASVTNLYGCFIYCYSLQTVTFPSGSLASVTDLSYCFNYCYSLQTVTFPSGSLASVTNLSGCFSYCTSLQTVTFPSGSLASVTNLFYCFNSCYSLQTVTFPSGSLASVTNLSGCFNSCYSLSSIVNAAFPITFDVSNCALTNTAIDAIFTALPTVSGQTATVTGNPGAATCTPSIATGKGWTVVQ